ncbi:MAG: hypothetical protein BAA02_10695 [Paenibacillaceae bacterium ZCTH02-B3]|nr:MAG: hypothetical protein BAA02_10695 [Paenibacillaceae bacterium ZCTH02-B3]
MPSTLTDRLASLVAEAPAASLPPKALERAKMALIDYIGVTIAGASEPVAGLIARMIRQHGSPGACTVIATDLETGPLDAALANGTAGHALDYDDSNFQLGGHPSVALYPAVLALGQKLSSSGRDVLDAYVIGFEVMMRLAACVNFEHYDRGWHPTATIGTFGAAAAAARLLKLPAGETRTAIGLAASMASGVKANFGTMSKPLQVGHASQKGLWCALLAAEGATASPDALEGKQGFFQVYNGPGQYRVPDGGAAEPTWGILDSGLMFKRYACCGSTHPAVDAALELKELYRVEPENIEAVTVRIHPRRLPHVNRPAVSRGLEGKFSLQYTVAAALADGEVGLRHFTDEAVQRPDIQRLLARVTAEPIDNPPEALSQVCEVEVRTSDGRRHRVRVERAKGRSADEFGSHLKKKFLDCAAQAFEAERAEELFSLLDRIGETDDVNELMRRLGAGGRR